MAKFIELDPSEITGNVFDRIGKEWMLITAGKPEKYNTMTASWGGLGVLWNANVSFAFVRPSRFLDPSIMASYKDGDFHRIYVGEITKVLARTR